MKYPPDAGLTILELVVALGLLAALLTIVASSIRPPTHNAVPVEKQIAALIGSVRNDAVLSGEPRLVQVEPQRLTAGTRQVAWTDASAILLGNGQERTSGATLSLIVYPDGTLSGAPLLLKVDGAARQIAGVFRDGRPSP